MFRENFFKILLIIGALSQVVYAKPASDVADNVAAPEKLLCNYHGVIVPSPDEKVPSSFRLLMVTLSDLMSSSVNYSKKVKIIADAILKDSELLAHIDNDEVKTFKEKLETFVKAYRDCNNGTKLFKLVKLLLGCTSEFYKQEENQKLSPEGKIILKLLKKHKLEEIEDELLENIENLVEKFEEKYPEVEDDLKNEEVYATGPKLVKWHELLITLKDYDELVEAVYNFFERFV